MTTVTSTVHAAVRPSSLFTVLTHRGCARFHVRGCIRSFAPGPIARTTVPYCTQCAQLVPYVGARSRRACQGCEQMPTAFRYAVIARVTSLSDKTGLFLDALLLDEQAEQFFGIPAVDLHGSLNSQSRQRIAKIRDTVTRQGVACDLAIAKIPLPNGDAQYRIVDTIATV
uniref:Replication factor A C-terminal domain-containing protein n=1 Tax=Sexangularia sp. CB-2014 TaxID=1486929 RepID=A0A7S1VK63_9EUKA